MEILRFPTGGLNLDDSPEVISPEDWTYAANIIDGKSYNGRNGEKENVLGTTLLESEYLDSNSVFIGGVRSAEDDVAFLCFYNSDPNKHCILKLSNKVISRVLVWSGLNFQNDKRYRINGGGLVGDLLYITDNYNEPRCIHTTRYADGSVPHKAEEILHHKRGPVHPPYADVSIIGEQFRTVQFAYQYEYADGQLSVISPWTKMLFNVATAEVRATESTFIWDAPEPQAPSLAVNIKFIARTSNDGVPHYIGDAPIDGNDEFPTMEYAGQNLGVVPDIYLKAYDLVPLRAKASCITKSRAWFANYIEGYNTPYRPRFELTVENSPETVEEGKRTLGQNAKYNVGIVLFDDQGRSCGVIDLGKIVDTGRDILPYSNTGTTGVSRLKRLKYRFLSEHFTFPAWAKQWALVLTPDTVKSWFMNFFAELDNECYVVVDSSGNETYTDTYSNEVSYIRIPMSALKVAGLAYTPVEGDMIMIGRVGSIGAKRVVKISGDYLYMDKLDIGSQITDRLMNLQIFRPTVVGSEIYYEIGQRHDISEVDVDHYYAGDCYVRSDTNGRFYSQIGPDPMKGIWYRDLGKPYIKTPVGQVHKKSFIRYSSPFIEGTNVNGLSEFNVGDEGHVPSEAIEIQKLVPTLRESSDGDVILAVCNSNSYSVYIGESRLSSNDGQSLVISTPNVIGDVRKHRSGYGTVHPESVIEEDGYVYMFDWLSRSYCRYATNGMFPISEYKVVDYFEDQASLNDMNDLVISGYDPFYKMIFVTFKNADTNTKRTIAYSVKKDRWISFFDFAPDAYITGSKHMYSVVGGNIYVHDNYGAFNSFYGQTFNSVISLSFNDSPDVQKNWKALQLIVSPNMLRWIDGEQVLVADAMRVDISNRKGQKTTIYYDEFEVNEDIVYGEIRGDEETGGVLEGDPIYSPSIQAAITFSGGSYKQILTVKAGMEPSRGHSL